MSLSWVFLSREAEVGPLLATELGILALEGTADTDTAGDLVKVGGPEGCVIPASTREYAKAKAFGSKSLMVKDAFKKRKALNNPTIGFLVLTSDVGQSDMYLYFCNVSK